MDALTLNDGTVLEGSYVIESGERLFFYVNSGLTIAEVFNLFIDPEKTKKLVCERYEVKETYRGYKRLYNVTDEGNGLVTGMLKKS